MEIVKSYTLYLNTREANYGSSNNCTFIFTTPIVLTNTNNRFLISCPMVELPYSFSQVNTTNYTLPYFYTDSNGINFNSTDMNIPEGNYNINALLAQLITSLIQNIQAHGGPVLTTANFTFLYNSQTGSVSLVMSNSYNIYITLKFSQAVVLGIMFGWTPTDIVINTTSTKISPNKVMVNPITSVYIRSDTLKFQSNYEAIVQTYQNSDILAKIPVTTLPNSIIYYRNDIKNMISNKFLADLNLYVSDNLSVLYQLDMQGVNYGIMITIDEVQMKPTNAFQDILHTGVVVTPKDLIQQRDDILHELIAQKEKLEKEIEEQKNQNAMEVEKNPT